MLPALLRSAEAAARDCGKTLLTLDTATDDAERLYRRMGWIRVGVIPGYSLLPRGGLCDSAIYYRHLARVDDDDPGPRVPRGRSHRAVRARAHDLTSHRET
jgi:hypothetical protein